MEKDQEKEKPLGKSEKQELEALRAENVKLRAQQEAEAKRAGSHYEELERIKNKANAAQLKIEYKDSDDHKNITLYHKNGLYIGKPVGPLHPSNAEQAFHAFRRLGILLSLTRPTALEISEYKKSAEYKLARSQFDAMRADRKKSRKGSEIERLTRLIAQASGVPENQLNNIKGPNEVVATNQAVGV